MDLGCLLLSPKLRVLHSWKSIRFHNRKGTALKVFLCWLSRWLGSMYRSAEHQCISKVLKFPCKSKVPRGFAQSALAKCWCNVGCTEWCVVCNPVYNSIYNTTMCSDCRKKQNGHWHSDNISPKVVLRWLQAKVDFFIGMFKGTKWIWRDFGAHEWLWPPSALSPSFPPTGQFKEGAGHVRSKNLWRETMSMHIYLVLALGGGGIYLY